MKYLHEVKTFESSQHFFQKWKFMIMPYDLPFPCQIPVQNCFWHNLFICYLILFLLILANLNAHEFNFFCEICVQGLFDNLVYGFWVGGRKKKKNKDYQFFFFLIYKIIESEAKKKKKDQVTKRKSQGFFLIINIFYYYYFFFFFDRNAHRMGKKKTKKFFFFENGQNSGQRNPQTKK